MDNLRAIHLRDLIALNAPEGEQLAHSKCSAENASSRVVAWATPCEETNRASEDPGSRLALVPPTADSREAVDQPSGNAWMDTRVMFICEAPAADERPDQPAEPLERISKLTPKGSPAPRPSSSVNPVKPRALPKGFADGAVGYRDFIQSVISTFKLRNVYMTNFVKCGSHEDEEDGPGAGFGQHSSDCVDLCYQQFLCREISTFAPDVIFGMSAAVVRSLHRLAPEHDAKLYRLPLPALQPAGSADDSYRSIYFWMIASVLFKCGGLSVEEIHRLNETFSRRPRIA